MKLDNVIIVLGKRLVNSQLTAEGITRVAALCNAIAALPIERTLLIFCGGKTFGQKVSEADAMNAYFKTVNAPSLHPFPERQVIVENRSLNTLQNIRNAAQKLCHSDLIDPSSITPVKVTLLSNDYHLERILEIQTLMNEQGLLRVLSERCALMGMAIDIPLDIEQHISVPYPHQGYLATAFLLLDELTTYRVYLEGVKNGVFLRDLTEVRAKPYLIASKAFSRLLALPLDEVTLKKIEKMKKAVEMTALDESPGAADHALRILHPTLTALNRQLDPESV